jgi:hypothetical protein
MPGSCPGRIACLPIGCLRPVSAAQIVEVGLILPLSALRRVHISAPARRITVVLWITAVLQIARVYVLLVSCVSLDHLQLLGARVLLLCFCGVVQILFVLAPLAAALFSVQIFASKKKVCHVVVSFGTVSFFTLR